MIIRLSSDSHDEIDAARRDLAELAASWQQSVNVIESPPVDPTVEEPTRNLDPVAIAALALSVPSTALAATDLVTRIRNRRRAGELIERARVLSRRQVTLRVETPHGVIDLTTLDEDQLLEIVGDSPND